MHATIPIRLPDTVIDQIDHIAQKLCNSRSGTIRFAIDSFLKSMATAASIDAVVQIAATSATETDTAEEGREA